MSGKINSVDWRAHYSESCLKRRSSFAPSLPIVKKTNQKKKKGLEKSFKKYHLRASFGRTVTLLDKLLNLGCMLDILPSVCSRLLPVTGWWVAREVESNWQTRLITFFGGGKHRRVPTPVVGKPK